MTNRIFERALEHHVEREPTVSVNGAGLSLAFLFGGAHMLWAALVASGFGQRVVDLLFWLHFIRPAWQIEPFESGRAAVLIGLTSVIGYTLGAAFALVWRRLQHPAL